jgi:mono/diheme cytochrome c family protein
MMKPSPRLILALGAALLAGAAHALTAAEQLSAYAREAAAAPQPERGRQLFTSPHGREWSCSSCHGSRPTAGGKHAGTGKPIAALAPAFNAERFTDSAKTEKWFRRNCKDVLGRECSAAEKSDLLAWLISLE